MRVILTHLTPAPFTQQVGRALFEADMLAGFFSTLVHEPEAFWQRAAIRVAGWLRYDLERDLKRRAVREFPLERTKTYSWREVVRMLVLKASRDPVLGDKVFHWARDGFDHWVSKGLGGADGVYGYEYGVLKTFARAKQMGLRTFYDLPSPEHDFVESLLAPEYQRFPELETPYRQLVKAKQIERTQHRREEWEMSDVVIANSTFTAESWRSAGWRNNRIVVVPYGAPPVAEDIAFPDRDGPLVLLWAGTFSVRKGAHHLLEAVRSLNVSLNQLRIEVYGAVTLPASLLSKAPANVVFRGSVPRSELFLAMQKSHALVFPTLCDGFGLVVNEALAQGLPVITTRRAGAADLIEENRNGWLIEPSNIDALKNSIGRCLDVREGLLDMRHHAQCSAARWQWNDYRKAIAAAVSGSSRP